LDVDDDEEEASSTLGSKDYANESEVEAYLREFPCLKLSMEAKAIAKKKKEANAICRAELIEQYESQITPNDMSDPSNLGNADSNFMNTDNIDINQKRASKTLKQELTLARLPPSKGKNTSGTDASNNAKDTNTEPSSKTSSTLIASYIQKIFTKHSSTITVLPLPMTAMT
jgi:hypothetical protein